MKEDKQKLLAKVAYMYYEQELTQAQIAKELSIYRTDSQPNDQPSKKTRNR